MGREKVSLLLDGTGALSALLRLRASTPTPWLTVVTYHRVAEPHVALAEDLDDGVIDARPADFVRQMAFLKRHCNVIGLDDLVAFKDGRSLPPNPVLVKIGRAHV